MVEACSGIRSLMTLVTLAVVFAYFTHSRNDEPRSGGASGSRFARLKSFATWRAVIIVLSAVPIAILTNVMRVSGTGVLARFYGVKVADGFFHSFSGWVMYIVAFLMLFAVGWLIDRFARPKSAETSSDQKATRIVRTAAADLVSSTNSSLVKGIE